MILQPSLSCRPGRHLCCVASAAGAGGSAGNASRRRSQRLRQPRDRSSRDLERQLREREARVAEQQRLLKEQEQAQQREEQEQQAAAAQPAPRWQAAGDPAAQRAQEEAARSLLGDLELDQTVAQELAALEQDNRGEGGTPAAAEVAPAGVAAAAAAAEEEDDDEDPAEPASSSISSAAAAAAAAEGAAEAQAAAASSAGAPPPPSVETVEADFVLEQQGAQALGQPRSPPDTAQSEFSRQAEALLAIIQAGNEVEEVIAERRADIDGTTLQLLARRIEAAQQVEKQPEVIEGLQLLYRRLKAEIDRQQASPALRLLDELMSILDPMEGGETVARSATREERRRQAAAHARAAFTGGLASGADVLSLAAQLSQGGGDQLADQLMADPVDPMQFMAESTELLRRVQQQLRQLEAYAEQLQQQEAARRGTEQRGATPQHVQGDEQLEGLQAAREVAAEEDEEARAAAAAVLEVEGMLEQRQAAAGLVQECLEIAQAVIQQLQLGVQV